MNREQIAATVLSVLAVTTISVAGSATVALSVEADRPTQNQHIEESVPTSPSDLGQTSPDSYSRGDGNPTMAGVSTAAQTGGASDGDNAILFGQFDHGRTYRANKVVTISGTMDYIGDCGSTGVDDQFSAFADVYVVNNSEGDAMTDGESLNDVVGTPNTIGPATAGGGYYDEIVGITAPAGNLTEGRYDVVIDNCQDGTFDASQDFIRSPDRPGLIVELPEEVPDASPHLQNLKQKAEFQAQFWRSGADYWDATFTGLEVYSKFGALTDPTDLLIYVTQKGVSKGLGVSGTEAAVTALENTANRYEGIHADPPDPTYRQVSTVGPRDRIEPGSGDELATATARLGTASSNEQALLRALRISIERYQGAKAAQDGEWALVHARAIRDYSTLLAAHIQRRHTALARADAALANDSRPLNATLADLETARSRVADSGLSESEYRRARNLGLTDTEIDGLERDIAAVDFNITKATVRRTNAEILANDSALITEFETVSTAMDDIVTTLEEDPLVADKLPIADAGGPYTVTEGATLTLNATGSTSATAITGYAWDLDADGEFDDATGPTPSVTFDRAFQGIVGLKVTTEDGVATVGYTPVEVTDANQRPSATFRPTNRSLTVRVGSTQAFNFSATDPEGESVSAEWFVDGTRVGTEESFEYTPSDADVGLHIVSAVVSDADPRGEPAGTSWVVRVLAPDVDGDGWRATADCDDEEPAVNPGQSEIENNARDDDCDPWTLDGGGELGVEFTTELASIEEDGTLPDIAGALSEWGRRPSISPDGQRVAFDARFNDMHDIRVHDRQIGETERIDTGRIAQTNPIIGGSNGRYVVFSGLEEPPASVPRHVYLYDRQQDTIEQVSVAGEGGDTDRVSEYRAHVKSNVVSADGQFVAFTSTTSLVPNDTDDHDDVFVRDRQANTTELISVSKTNEEGSGDRPSISADGRYVAFQSWSRLLPGRSLDPTAPHVFVHDRATGATELVSSTSDGTPIEGQTPSISADGRYVAFAAGSVPREIRVHDRVTGETELASVALDGTPARGLLPDISGNGRFVVFKSTDENLVANDTNDATDIFLYDRRLDRTRRVDVSSNGSQGEAFENRRGQRIDPLSDNPTISADGRAIAFQSRAPNLVPNDTNEDWDIFVHEWEFTQTGGPGGPDRTEPVADAGGPYTVAEGSTVTLNGGNSSHPDRPLGFGWDLDGNGTFESRGQNVTVSATTIDGPANRTATVRVCINSGLCANDTARVTVTDVAPDVTVSGDTISEGNTATIEVTVTDPGPDTHEARIDWDDGTNTTVGAATGSFERSHEYGDTGEYDVTVTVRADDGTTTVETGTVTVENSPPNVTLAATDTVSFPGGEARLGGVGDTQTPDATAIDPGSDDLTFAWSFGRTASYLNDATGPDEFPSPNGTFPFTARDTGQVTFSTPGTHVVFTRVTDDDGGVGVAGRANVITGDRVCTRTQEFWREQFGTREPQQIDNQALQGYLDVVTFGSGVFSEQASADTPADARAVFGTSSGGGQGGVEVRGRARGETLAAWLNFASGAVGWNERIDTDGDGEAETPFNEVMTEVESVLRDPDATQEEVEQARDIAESVNNLPEESLCLNRDADDGDGGDGDESVSDDGGDGGDGVETEDGGDGGDGDESVSGDGAESVSGDGAESVSDDGGASTDGDTSDEEEESDAFLGGFGLGEGQSDCELFGVDYGSFIICWYWWLLAAGIGLALVSYRIWRRGAGTPSGAE
ncbi:MAG: PKD domain-containing protein [Haloarculaceae archaeon]